MILAYLLNMIASNPLRFSLDIEIQGRAYLESSSVDCLGSILLHQQLSDVHDEVGSVDIETLWHDRDFFVLGDLGLFCRDVFLEMHLRQIELLAFFCCLEVIDGVQQRILGYGC